MRRYPRAEKYDQSWVGENWMGPHPLYLLEELCGNMDLRPGMKVLDMGCGKGCSSVFLAKEYGVTVFANDLWISPTENLCRFEEAGVADRVFPIRAEAHALPYAENFFDVAVSVDSYHYYGTDDTYLPDTYSKLVKSKGQLGMVSPGLIYECLKDTGDGFHSGEWWRGHWEKTGLVNITACYDFDDPKSVDEELFAAAGENFALIVMAAVKKV